MSRLSSSSVAGLRSIVRPEYANLGPADLEQVVDASMADMSSDAAENFLSALSSQKIRGTRVLLK